jgi:UDP-sugar transporter A1/2/3
VGVTVVQSDNHKSDSDAPHPETGLGYQTLGFLAVVAAAFTSGFCGVYQQKILQAGKTNMWVRNAQMGLTSVTLGVISTIVKDRQAIQERGFFQGYTKLVWTVIVIQAVGGLNVAFILKYADNILKGFAAAFSTVASCVLEMAIMHFRPTATFLLGGALINVAAYCYNTPGRKEGNKLPR